MDKVTEILSKKKKLLTEVYFDLQLHFEEKYPDCEIVTLTKNYRSTEHIVELINNSIKHMKLGDLQSSIKGGKDIHLEEFTSEDEEFKFEIQKII